MRPIDRNLLRSDKVDRTSIHSLRSRNEAITSNAEATRECDETSSASTNACPSTSSEAEGVNNVYRLALDADFSFLEGIELLQICVGKNELNLNFDNDIRLTILSDFGVSTPHGPGVVFEEPSKGAGALFPLLHDTIRHAEVAAQGKRLALTFRSGVRLELIDTSDQYESFWVTNGQRKIVV